MLLRPSLFRIMPLFCLVLLQTITMYCQHEDDHRFSKPEYVDVKIGSPKEKIIPGIAVNGLYVYDSRPDSTQVGVLYTSRPDVVLLRLKERLPEEVKHFYGLLLDQPVNPAAWGEIHCFIKRLSLSDLISIPMTDQERTDASGKFDNKEASGVKLRMEFYLKKNDHFIPAWRFDSLWTGSKGVLQEGGRYIASALSASFRRAATLNWARLLSEGKRLSWNDIMEYNRQAFAYPALTSLPAKGVFLSFEDFRNNKVTHSNFTVNRDKKGDFLYVKSPSGEETLLTDLWGYSDGRDVFIYSASNFFKLYRLGNSFLFYGAKDYTRKRVMRLNFRLIDVTAPNSLYSKERTRTKYTLEKDYLQLDWDTGEIY